MSDDQRTYDIASSHIQPYVQPLWQGAHAMPIDTSDEDGRRISLADDHLSGHYLILAFVNDTRDEQAIPVLSALAKLQPLLEASNATVVAVSATSNAARNREIKKSAGFPWPVASDSSGAIFASYGLHKENGEAVRLVLVTPYRQIRTWFDSPTDIDDTLKTIMNVLDNTQAAEELRWGPPHAPVLIVPNVLSEEECGMLVESCETGVPFMVRQPRPGEIAGNYNIPVYEHERQDRVDQIIKDQATLTFLDDRLFGRVTPMIKKAFAFDVTQREDLHIARYVGKRGGITMGHRDNTRAETAYRRFALSMSLNDNYEGGEIAFKEFSPKGYRVPAGTAIVFSSSLLHEVQETISGTRYNLISHFFNEQALPK
jgi:peroxiredoxin/predicted 2-oxoglutarate/Fe(II)-dependent dioxygenase YbiX